MKDPCGRLARWALKLQQYELDIVHREDKKHVVSAVLSRSVPDIVEVTTTDPAWRVEGGNLSKFVVSKFPAVYGDSPEVKKVIGNDGRGEILKQCHDNPWTGHMSVKKTLARVSQKSYWS